MPIRPENRDRSCGWCGETFTPYLGRRDVRWCSTLCKKRAESARPRSVPKVCPVCGEAFTPERSAKQRYCGAVCKRAGRTAAVMADPEQVTRLRERQRAYSRTPAYRAAQRSAKARRRSQERAGTVTVAEWEGIQDAYGGRCAYCLGPGPLTQDHVVPLAKGGRHEPGNVVPACGSCNSRKGTNDWTERLPCLFALK